jgi:hypothetical protein
MTDATPPPTQTYCRHLRTKKMYYVADLLEVEEDLLTSNTYQNWWCNHTQTDTGPDDGFVELIRCQPGRGCYEGRGG